MASLLQWRSCRGRFPRALGVLLLGGAGCFLDRSLDPPPLVLAAVDGDAQTAPAGDRLATPFAVRVTQGGTPVANVAVRWEVVGGGGGAAGTVEPGRSFTDGAGVARAGYRLGGAPGPQQVRAALEDDPSSAVTFTATALLVREPALASALLIAPDYGIHDTFVRDGIAILCNWNSGITILDVGGGGRGGTPEAPVVISTFRPSNGSLPSPSVHNAWWFKNPVTGEARYLFLGQEGPGSLGASSRGDLMVLDVSNLAAPVEVGFFRIAAAGAHNFWMDEARQRLYAAFYNGGVVALDVSGVLAGDLASREIARVTPGGPGATYVWGVMVAGGRLYASDMVSGFWQLDPTTLQPVGGGNNVPDRFGSDLWVADGFGYTGTWGTRNARPGNAVKIWRLGPTGAPALADSIIVPGVGTVSDLEVSPDGRALVITTEGAPGAGLYVYRLTEPGRPLLVGRVLVPEGLHAASLAVINGRLYAFAAQDPPMPALRVYDLSGVFAVP